MRWIWITAFLTLLGCGRPLTEAEISFLSDLHGTQLDPAPVRILSAGPVGAIERTLLARPRTTCRERLLPPPDGPTVQARTAGVVIYEQMLTRPGWYLDDYAARWPEAMNLSAAMFFAHEMTHVWQWQNRDRTGYRPLRAAAEHRGSADPYLFDPDTRARFLDYPYEQQASLVEEYVCCRTLDPDGDRTQRLRALLSQELPIRDAPRPAALSVPWDGVEVRGICS